MASPSSTLHQFATPLLLKLDDDNFLLLKQQILATIDGLNLMQFLEGTNVPSQYTTSDDQSNCTIFAAFLQYRQHQLTVTWLLALMAPYVRTKMVGLRSSAQIWQRLETYYASHTRAKIKKVKLQLKNPKNNRYITSYLQDIKKFVDIQAAMGVPIFAEDHIDSILDGLFEDYDPFIIVVTSHTDPYTIDKIDIVLFAQEERFDKHKLSHSTFKPIRRQLLLPTISPSFSDLCST